jgi:hypothetical protein
VKRFSCRCGQRVFFEDFFCLACRTPVGFAPWQMDMVPMDGTGMSQQACRNRHEHGICNWLVPPGDPSLYCNACRLNRVIPNLSHSRNIVLWGRIERAKRRMLYGVIGLRLPIDGLPDRPPMAFEFLEDQRDNPLVEEVLVMIGHRAGLITVNIHEADDSRRHAVREAMFERYRTLLGHFRHECGHYFWDLLTGDDPDDFRALFGDERMDYNSALARYYEHGPVANWNRNYISAYATAHPLEDWAETWAHYLHIVDGLETAHENALGPAPIGRSWDAQVTAWMEVAVEINELNRSLGTPDPYPFVLTAPIQQKLDFIHRKLEAWRRASATPAGAGMPARG